MHEDFRPSPVGGWSLVTLGKRTPSTTLPSRSSRLQSSPFESSTDISIVLGRGATHRCGSKNAFSPRRRIAVASQFREGVRLPPLRAFSTDQIVTRDLDGRVPPKPPLAEVRVDRPPWSSVPVEGWENTQELETHISFKGQENLRPTTLGRRQPSTESQPKVPNGPSLPSFNTCMRAFLAATPDRDVSASIWAMIQAAELESAHGYATGPPICFRDVFAAGVVPFHHIITRFITTARSTRPSAQLRRL